MRLSVTFLKKDEAVSYLAANEDVNAALGNHLFGKLVNGGSGRGVGGTGRGRDFSAGSVGGSVGGQMQGVGVHHGDANFRVERIVDAYSNGDLRGPIVGGDSRGGGGGSVGRSVGGGGGVSFNGRSVNSAINGGGGGGGGVSVGHLARTGQICGAPNTFYSEPMDCSIFYVCTHGKLVRFLCPGGSVWNQKKSVCDWECDNFS